MPIVGGLDIHRKQITFDYLDTATGEVRRGQIAPADRAHLRAWLARFAGRDDAAFALEGCTGWRRRLPDFTEYRLPDMDKHGIDMQVLSLSASGAGTTGRAGTRCA